MARMALVVLMGLLPAGATPQQLIFRAGTDIVTIPVTVTDRRNNLVADLTAADFALFEDGRPQRLDYFAIGRGGASPPLHVGLVLDTSGSMSQDIQMARTAAVRFLNTLPEAQDITLVDFDTEVRVARYRQDDFPRLVERIRTRKPAGLTAMYDALGVYLDGAQDNAGRTILVVLTDGGDTRSAMPFGDLLALIRASSATIYSIGLLQNQPGRVRQEQRLRLAQIAAESGGEAFFPLSLKDVDEAYDRILSHIDAQYHLGFVSTNRTADGAWRRIEVRLTRPELRDLRVRSRRGYFAPGRP